MVVANLGLDGSYVTSQSSYRKTKARTHRKRVTFEHKTGLLQRDPEEIDALSTAYRLNTTGRLYRYLVDGRHERYAYGYFAEPLT